MSALAQAEKWLCPGMTDCAGQLALYTFPPGFCGLRVKHMTHRYLDRAGGEIYACPGAARPPRDAQHVREGTPEAAERPAPPDAPLISGPA